MAIRIAGKVNVKVRVKVNVKVEFTNPHIFPDFLANLRINMYLCRQKANIMERSYTTNISSVDALWVLIQGQTQSVKDALYRRMEEANLQRKTLQQQQYVSKSLKRAFTELEEARTTNTELPDASDLFKLMD